MHGGIAQGQNRIGFADSPVLQLWVHPDPVYDDLGFEGGETRKQVRDRAYHAMQIIFETSPHETIAISSHGRLLMQLLRVLLHDQNATIGKMDNAQYIELSRSDRGWSM